MSLKLEYEEVLTYPSFSRQKNPFFMSKADWKTLFSSKLSSLMFGAYHLALIAIFTAGWYVTQSYFFIGVFVTVSFFFIRVVNKELARYSYKRTLLRSNDSLIKKLSSSDVNGWYDDPFSNGKPGYERYWRDGAWTKETRASLPSKNA